MKLYETQRRLLDRSPDNAATLAGPSEPQDRNRMMDAATLVAVVRTLMNLDEFVTRE
jgi:hypothetical protein